MIKNRSKNETKRQQILAAATFLFTEQGYAATSMALIAKQADVSKQTVYSHFGSKDELFSAAIAQKCDSIVMLNVKQLDLSDPRITLLTLAQRFLTIVTSKEALAVHKICAFESKNNPHLSELFFVEGVERLTSEVAKLMARFNHEGILVIDEPRYAAVQFLHMVKGEAWMRVEFNTEKQFSQAEIDAYLQATVDFFLRGYAVI